MIVRRWTARTSADKVARYIDFFRRSVLPALQSISGYRSGELLTRDLGECIEIVVNTTWASEQAIRQFAGAEMSRANVEPEAAAVLDDFDDTVTHYELVLDMSESFKSVQERSRGSS